MALSMVDREFFLFCNGIPGIGSKWYRRKAFSIKEVIITGIVGPAEPYRYRFLDRFVINLYRVTGYLGFCIPEFPVRSGYFKTSHVTIFVLRDQTAACIGKGDDQLIA